MHSGLNFIHSDVFYNATWELDYPSYVLFCDLAKSRNEFLAFVLAMGELKAVAFIRQNYFLSFLFYFYNGFKRVSTWAKNLGTALSPSLTAFCPSLIFPHLAVFGYHFSTLSSWLQRTPKPRSRASTIWASFLIPLLLFPLLLFL